MKIRLLWFYATFKYKIYLKILYFKNLWRIGFVFCSQFRDFDGKTYLKRKKVRWRQSKNTLTRRNFYAIDSLLANG